MTLNGVMAVILRYLTDFGIGASYVEVVEVTCMSMLSAQKCKIKYV